MRRLLLTLLFAAGLVVLGQSAASAADFTVNSSADTVDANPGNGVCATAGGTCTLRAAVMEAESLSGSDTISVPAMTISLGSYLSITKTTTIRGAGARSTIITGTPGHILIGIAGGDVVVRDLSLQGATASNGAGLAIQQTGNAATKLIAVRVANNHITAGVSAGAGPVYVIAGEMEIRDSSITGNSTTSSGQVIGGGVYVYGAGTKLLIENSTIHGNTVTSSADSFGGGIATGTGSVTTIRSSTITNNSALNTVSLSGTGGNLYRGASTTVENSIIAGGVSTWSSYANCYGTVSFTGRNIVSDASCGAANVNRLIADPQLGTLADNGGGTDARSPSLTSPALNAASACASAADQRGQLRPIGPACEIGAIELGADLSVTQTVSNASPSPGGDVVFTVQVTNAGMDNASATSLAVDVPGSTQITSVSSLLGSCSVTGTRVTCALGTVNRGTPANVLIVARAPGTGLMTSNAVVSSNIPDPNPSNNAASATATVPGTAPSADDPGVPAGPCTNVIRGNRKANKLRGTSGGDRMLGLAGKDVLRARGGADCLDGGRGNDRLVASTGDDLLVGGKGRDRMLAGAGADQIRARDGKRDIVKCGAGEDTVLADKVDRVAKDCERVRRK